MNGYAQDSTIINPKNMFWVSAALGAPTADGLSINYQYKKNLFTLRYSAYSSSFERVYEEYSLLYGRNFINKNHFLLSASAGFGVININSVGILSPSKPIENNLPNFPIESQVIFSFCKYAGIGLKGFVNINSYSVSGGALFTLEIGKLR